jgi:hypothetical protein
MVSFDDVNNFGSVHLSNPEVSKIGILFCILHRNRGFRSINIDDEEWS